MTLKALATFALGVTLASVTWADTLVLRDGRVFQGELVSFSQDTVIFQTGQGQQYRFSTGDVRNLEFDSNTGNGPATQANTQQSTTQTSQAATQARVIPSGSQVSVRTNEAINSDTATTGRSYSGTVVEAVRDSAGNVIIPAGSPAELVVDRVSEPGTVGSAELALGMRSVQVGGQRYLITTEPVERSGREGIGANRRTATMVGGGALLGTLVGAAAGGGRGAAIGALIGAVGGGTAQVLTRGDKVNVPAETVLTFQLDAPVQLQPAQK